MAKVTRAFKACLPGDVYPRSFAPGDDVTGEAERIGREMGCVDGAPTKKALKGAPENKSE